MNTQKLSLSSIKNVLSRAEMKQIMAGSGGCCAHKAGWTDYQCGYSSVGEAQAAADYYASNNGVQAFYCCDHC